MDGVVAYILGKSYTKKSLIGIGALAGAPCQVQSINKVGKTTTITLKWEDNVGGVHTQAFDVEDGLDGVSVSNATIKPNGHLELTLSNGNSIDCGQVLPQYDTMPTPSASNEGQILQYIGTTTSSYTNGYFYQCINDGGIYKWVEKSVQDSYTKGQIGSLSDLPDTSKNVIENIADIKLSVDQLAASKLSISDIDNALSDVSENPVQNKVIKLTLDQLRGSILDKLDEKEDKFRYSTMPTASVDYLNKIVEYIGATDSTYTNGYFYQCRFDGTNYNWVQKNIQPNNGGGGGDGVVDGYYNPLDQLFYEDSSFLNPITGEDNTIYVDLNTNGLYRYDGIKFIKVSSSTDSYTKAEIGDLSDLPDTSKNVIENIDLLSDDIDLLNGSILTIKTDITQLQGSLINKVDKITGKGLSTNDYTDDDKEKLVKLSPIYLIGSGLNLDSTTGELTASGIDVPIDTELSDTSINPVQNKVITLAIDQLQGSVLNKIQKMLGAQEDNFTVIDNNGGVKDSGISKNVVPTTASASNKLLVASDLSAKADKVSGAVDNDIALLDSTGNLKDSTKKLSDLQDKLTEGNGIDIDTNNKISVDISYLTASRVGYIPSTEKGTANGVAELDSAGKVPSAQLPSYVDDVIEGYKDGANFYTDSAHTNLITPESGKIYVDLHTDTTWRWSGTAYVQISESLALGETSTTAYRGDRGKTAYDHSQITDGSNPHNTTADNVNLKVPIPALSGSKLDVESTLYGINTELGKKADKVASATNGHLAGLDSNGNLTDSNVVANDVIQKVATATGLLRDDGTVDTNTYLTASDIEDKADLTDLASEFDTTIAYTTGQYVIYNGDVYRFRADHSAGAWIGTDATKVDIGNELTTSNKALSDVLNVYGSKNLLNFSDTISVTANTNNTYELGSINLTQGDVIVFRCWQNNSMTSNVRNTLGIVDTISGTQYWHSTSSNRHLSAGSHVYIFTVQNTGKHNFRLWTNTLDVDTTYSDFMVCTKAVYDFDEKVVPYAMTNKELTDKILLGLQWIQAGS